MYLPASFPLFYTNTRIFLSHVLSQEQKNMLFEISSILMSISFLPRYRTFLLRSVVGGLENLALSERMLPFRERMVVVA